jgi:hypothetical protein
VKRDTEAFLNRLWQLEDLLVAHGFPPMPPWWRREIARFYRSGKRRWVIRKGRRVYASTCIAPRLAVAEMLYGQHQHLPGTPPIVYAFLSVKMDEAAKRLRGVTAILDALGEEYTTKGDTVELVNRPAIFAVVAANLRTAVGDTLGFVWGDEVSRMRDAETGANPAEGVFGSLAPALATLPDAKLILVSSPLAKDDYHAKCFDLGETAAQCVSFGATWEINTTLTEAQTHEIEPDFKTWRREFAAIPQDGASSAFDRDHVLRCVREVPANTQWWPPIGVLDSAAGKRAGADSMTWGILANALPPAADPYLHRLVPVRNHVVIDGVDMIIDDPHERVSDYVRDANGQPVRNPEASKTRMPILVMKAIDSISGVFSSELDSGRLWDRIGKFYQWRGVTKVFGDQYIAPMAKKELRRFGITYTELKFTADTKASAVYRLRQLMADSALILPNHEKLINECLAFQERVAPSGVVTFHARGAGKDDHADLLLAAVLAEADRQLPGSQLYEKRIRHEVRLTGGSENIY